MVWGRLGATAADRLSEVGQQVGGKAKGPIRMQGVTHAPHPVRSRRGRDGMRGRTLEKMTCVAVSIYFPNRPLQ